MGGTTKKRKEKYNAKVFDFSVGMFTVLPIILWSFLLAKSAFGEILFYVSRKELTLFKMKEVSQTIFLAEIRILF